MQWVRNASGLATNSGYTQFYVRSFRRLDCERVRIQSHPSLLNAARGTHELWTSAQSDACARLCMAAPPVLHSWLSQDTAPHGPICECDYGGSEWNKSSYSRSLHGCALAEGGTEGHCRTPPVPAAISIINFPTARPKRVRKACARACRPIGGF